MAYRANSIILVSDGAPSDDKPKNNDKHIQDLNQKRTRINTVAVGDFLKFPIHIRFLNQPAKDNKGQFVGVIRLRRRIEQSKSSASRHSIFSRRRSAHSYCFPSLCCPTTRKEESSKQRTAISNKHYNSRQPRPRKQNGSAKKRRTRSKKLIRRNRLRHRLNSTNYCND